MAGYLLAAARWARRVWLPYGLLVLSILAVTALAGNRNRILVLLGFVPLAGASAWLNDKVRQDRKRGGDGPRGRFILAIVQAAVGLVLVVVGLQPLGGGVDWVFFLGVALMILAAGAVVSEGRKLRGRRRPAVITGLLVAAVVFLVAGAAVHAAWFLVAAALGIAAGELGTELISEDSHAWDRLRARWWLVGALGAVMVGVAFWMFRTGGAEPSHAVYLVLALLVLVWMASSDSDSLVLLLLAAVALTWAAAPRSVAPNPNRAPVADDSYFLTLGDSYISGEGADVYLDGTNTTEVDEDDHLNECRQAPGAWPLLLARSQAGDVPDRTMFLACSGAVTENIHTAARRDDDGDQLGPAELDLYERQQEADGLDPPAFVLVMVGGNDAGFGDIGTNCVGPGNCAEVGQQFLDDPERPDPPDDAEPADPFAPPGRGPAEDLVSIADDLDAAYTRIAGTVGEGVPVVAVPYPVPLTATGRCDDVLLQADERHFVVGFVRQLNEVVAAAASRHGFHYMTTMEGAFEQGGNRLCEGTGLRSGVNFLALNPKAGTVRDSLNPTNWIHNSLHPNAQGHEAMRDAAARWFRANRDLVPLEADPDAEYAVADINHLSVDWPGTAQCTPVGSADCEVSGSKWLFDQTHQLYQSALGALALAMVGAWLFLSPLMWFGRDREISAAKIVRCTLSRPGPP